MNLKRVGLNLRLVRVLNLNLAETAASGPPPAAAGKLFLNNLYLKTPNKEF